MSTKSNVIIFLPTVEEVDSETWELLDGTCTGCTSILTLTSFKDQHEARRMQGYQMYECIPCNRRFYTKQNKYKKRRKRNVS